MRKKRTSEVTTKTFDLAALVRMTEGNRPACTPPIAPAAGPSPSAMRQPRKEAKP